jgi:hypothetical protein
VPGRGSVLSREPAVHARGIPCRIDRRWPSCVLASNADAYVTCRRRGCRERQESPGQPLATHPVSSEVGGSIGQEPPAAGPEDSSQSLVRCGAPGKGSRIWVMRFELRVDGASPRVLCESVPCKYKYRGAARIAAAVTLRERYGDAATLRDVQRADLS